MRRWMIGVALVGLGLGCSGSAVKPAGGGAKAAAPASGERTLVKGRVFVNGAGARLTIGEVVPGERFGFQLVITAPEDCAGVKYGGTAVHKGAGEAKSELGDSFRIGKGTLRLEPAVEQIGMACARVLHVEFSAKR